MTKKYTEFIVRVYHTEDDDSANVPCFVEHIKALFKRHWKQRKITVKKVKEQK